jgi:hypothetical protein
MRAKRIDHGGDLVTLWHVGGASPCHGPALKVPAVFLEVEDPTLPAGCETCGQHLGDDLGSELALSRGR